jgi:putative RecB family exonuclease
MTTETDTRATEQSAERPRVPGLSPSRANDFMQCPLLFRFRVIDRLPEPPSAAAARGTLVHAVLESLFDEPAGGRTLDHARELLGPRWAGLVEARPEYAELVADDAGLEGWLAGAGELLGTYFTLEDPNYLEPRSRELSVSTQLEDGPQLRGIVDRLDVAPTGEVRVVDYKTGRSPRPGYSGSAEFQMRFYALVLWRETGEVPRMLQLVYLGDGQVLRSQPTEAALEVTEQKVRALWTGIESMARAGQFPPRRSALCGWCAHQAHCPEFGGTPPEFPAGAALRAIGVGPDGA